MECPMFRLKKKNQLHKYGMGGPGWRAIDVKKILRF